MMSSVNKFGFLPQSTLCLKGVNTDYFNPHFTFNSSNSNQSLILSRIISTFCSLIDIFKLIFFFSSAYDKFSRFLNLSSEHFSRTLHGKFSTTSILLCKICNTSIFMVSLVDKAMDERATRPKLGFAASKKKILKCYIKYVKKSNIQF